MNDLCSVEGQVAIVTGGTAGIGLACVERFAAEGAKVAIVARTAATGEAVTARLNKGGAETIFIAGDCASGDDMRAASTTILDIWGRADILVNCAGGFVASPAFEDYDDDAWEAGIAWSLSTKFLLTREIVPAMKRNAYGRILNISSLAGRTGIPFAPADYSAGTAAVIGLTRRLAIELAPFSITANVVAPGTVRSPRAESLGEERLSQIASMIPVGRIGAVEELAHAAWFLCTPGSAFTTGAVLDVNGGIWTG
ncbi:MAG: SDR family oxidoreductase [Alphaproteobacteria bacterium]|nr:SDR family oxidoreductase [Alphaproteobacteria bacterium]